jgi:hypothetical protein
MKTIKTDYGMKIKMLLDKAENDDKLIGMLKQEITRLENIKGAKSVLKEEYQTSIDTEIHKLKREVANLKN